MTFLDTIGIHVSDIEKAYELACDALAKCYLNSRADEIRDIMADEVEDGDLPLDGNCIMDRIFSITYDIIKEEYPTLEPRYDAEFDIEFDIEDDGFFDRADEIGVEPDDAKLIMKNRETFYSGLDVYSADALIDLLKDLKSKSEYVYNDIIKSVADGNTVTFYEDLDELNSEYEKENYGKFLLRAYKDGQSRDVYIKLDDGRILSCPVVQEHVPVKSCKEDIEK